MPDTFEFQIIDAFTPTPFSGNPASVVLVSAWPSDKVMRKVAAEFNLSETAYLLPLNNEKGKEKEVPMFGLRWWTPTVEVSLCGHATLAAAHVVFGMHQNAELVEFSTLSGILKARRRGQEIELDFPEDTPNESNDPAIWRAAIDGLGVAQEEIDWIGKGRDDAVVVLKPGYEVKAIVPVFPILEKIEVRGIIVTSASSEPYHFRSRFFGPRCGIPEDPVTGSAHCTLACLWTLRLHPDSTEEVTLKARQNSARGGELSVTWDRKGRVRIGGRACEVASGRMVWPE